ncbi:MAG TPA: DUF1294 domain-containing protein [Bacillota bacterium]
MLKVIGIITFILNITGFVAVALDKYKARHHRWRIPERFFFTIAVFGASPGVYCGCRVFRHKTRHPSFMWGLPAIAVLQIGGVVYLYFHCLIR